VTDPFRTSLPVVPQRFCCNCVHLTEQRALVENEHNTRDYYMHTYCAAVPQKYEAEHRPDPVTGSTPDRAIVWWASPKQRNANYDCPDYEERPPHRPWWRRLLGLK
jgi:hypothetical protein